MNETLSTVSYAYAVLAETKRPKTKIDGDESEPAMSDWRRDRRILIISSIGEHNNIVVSFEGKGIIGEFVCNVKKKSNGKNKLTGNNNIIIRNAPSPWNNNCYIY